VEEADPTLSPGGDTEAGTQAASPKALAEAAVAAGSHAQTQDHEPKPSGWATASVRPSPTAAEALDRSDLPRMRMFHIFGIFAPLAALAMSLAMGGDTHARYAFWAGAGLLSVANAGLVWLSSSTERWQPTPVGILWIIATTGVTPALYYFGPFSAAVMVLMLGIVFIALGRSRWTSLAVVGICIGGHIALATPILLGWIEDVGVMSSIVATKTQLAFAEALIVLFLCSGYALGRWARHTNATALAELQSAMRVIGDQQQALAEHVDVVQQVNRENEGRWTGQVMGGYKLGLVIGRGAMGDVYEAVGENGRTAAVKLLNARSTASTSLVERFHREMDVAAKLESPHIVRCTRSRRPMRPCRSSRWSGSTGRSRDAAAHEENRSRATSSSSCSIRSGAVSRSRASRESCIAISSRTTCSCTKVACGRCSTSACRRCSGAKAR
jgi:hypothetical protein